MEKTKGKKIKELAQQAVKEYVLHGREMEPPVDLEKKLAEKKGVFVSLKKNGQLRGCIGTVKPTQKNLAREITKNAVSACGHDPRFSPVKPEELEDLNISVDVLGELEPISGLEELDPQKYGVVVKKGHQTGLLLPNLEGIDTPEKQVSIACKKAGVTFSKDVELFRFEVERFD
ncbi:MAG: AmmeMemoRadiSam system protein A [Halanaerobiaceae bacterium]